MMMPDPEESDGPSEEFMTAFREYQDLEDDESADPDTIAHAFWAAVKSCTAGGYDDAAAPEPKKEPKLALIFGKAK